MSITTETETKVQLGTEIKASNKKWLAHHKADTGKGIGELVDEAIEALRRRYSESIKLEF
jgi:hypothetical protein